MAKTLAQGRKPGSGRKPGKGKTLREGRKPGSGRRPKKVISSEEHSDGSNTDKLNQKQGPPDKNNNRGSKKSVLGNSNMDSQILNTNIMIPIINTNMNTNMNSNLMYIVSTPHMNFNILPNANIQIPTETYNMNHNTANKANKSYKNSNNNNIISTRDLEALDALRELTTSPPFATFNDLSVPMGGSSNIQANTDVMPLPLPKLDVVVPQKPFVPHTPFLSNAKDDFNNIISNSSHMLNTSNTLTTHTIELPHLNNAISDTASLSNNSPIFGTATGPNLSLGRN